MSAIVLSKPIQWSQLLGRQDLLDRKTKVDFENLTGLRLDEVITIDAENRFRRLYLSVDNLKIPPSHKENLKKLYLTDLALFEVRYRQAVRARTSNKAKKVRQDSDFHKLVKLAAYNLKHNNAIKHSKGLEIISLALFNIPWNEACDIYWKGGELQINSLDTYIDNLRKYGYELNLTYLEELYNTYSHCIEDNHDAVTAVKYAEFNKHLEYDLLLTGFDNEKHFPQRFRLSMAAIIRAAFGRMNTLAEAIDLSTGVLTDLDYITLKKLALEDFISSLKPRELIDDELNKLGLNTERIKIALDIHYNRIQRRNL